MNKQNITIGKIVLTVLAIAVLFVPVVAVYQIEARAITHALEIEGLYINGTGIETTDISNTTITALDTIYSMYDTNYSSTYDTICIFSGSGINKDIYYRDYITYLGNYSYSVSINYTDWPIYAAASSYIIIPIDLNSIELLEADFLRIQSTYSVVPKIGYITEIGIQIVDLPMYEVSSNEYIGINTINTRSWITNTEDNYPINQIVIMYQVNPILPPADDTFTLKIQTEVYTGGDILTWNDETLYIMGIVLCDILLIGAIVFASDPIDIFIDRKHKR